MQRTSLADVTCSIARTLDVVGEWWTPLVLRDLFVGLTRFEDIRRDLGVASNVLAARLDRLVEHGVVERRPYQDAPPRSEYVLTDKGRELLPILLAIAKWGDRWTARKAGPPAVVRHDPCGHLGMGVLVCEACGGELTADTTTALPGPGAKRGPGTAVIGTVLVR